MRINTGKEKYSYSLIVLFLIQFVLLLSCGRKSECDKNEIYKTKREFGEVANQISKNKLDSIISDLPYWKLNEFKTADSKECIAVEILKKYIKTKGWKTNQFIIYSIKKENDLILEFYLDHIDGLVYRYNLDKLNSELSEKTTADGFFEVILPITGNVSGYEGCYLVDIGTKEVKVVYAQ
ncbi:hypothetical protein [Carboxylicivirga marina]|uniref:Lipoprotein n=1 Tax=Carboxylicivirga marina TaxID=2800988 RepID=A0ABS1HRU4_9BACT|nr:hypothetical protein [Carboxylicivirga marina]MBK3519904.1 hypothetical protein [Carboxylicivirga marina]